MAGYSGTPLAAKLGIKAGFRVCALGAPTGYRELLEPLPPAVEWTKEATRDVDLVHFFTTRREELADALLDFRQGLGPEAVIWISWPKQASKVPSEVNENWVRELALPLGLVDVKVCAVDETWSGLKLVLRKELR
ncbi:MAG TPA: DUF3052 family protein [Thermoanaerobaculia bacterium]|nr:DUF3052 family protein [Thermoanaerobaculia bacterium]